MADEGHASAAPLILTLHLDEASFARLHALRRAHFPAERNVVPAHLTLFHALPGERFGEVLDTLRGVAGDAGPLPFRATEIVSLGRGAAVRLDVPGLAAVRGRIARAFEDALSAQDRQAPRFHVTVQNKVGRDAAARTLATLRAGFAPWEGTGTGLDLWHYRGGPWEPAGSFPFAG